MKTQIKTLLTVLLVIMMLSIMLGAMFLMASATETSPEWVDDYTVEASCDSSLTALGSFNGSSACVHNQTGELHYCTVNFPYSEMQCAVYDIFMNTIGNNSPENVNAVINGNVFIDLDTALEVKSIDVHTHTRSKNDTPTVQGVQYFTELTYFVFDGDGLYDGRYDGDDTLKSIDLSKNTKITELRLEYVSMESVDLSANTEIVELVLIHASTSTSSRENGFKGLKRFKSLDLSKLTKLEDLTIYDEDIEALDLSGNTKLTRLDLRLLQKLKTIDISKNDALEYLYVSRSGLAEFDLGSKPNLTQADIIINANLKSVNLTGCTALRDLRLANNALENVDFSKNTALESLNVNQNQFKTLDLSKNTGLTSLSCQGNLLTCLDLNANTKLSNANLNTQYPVVASVTDDVLDLKSFSGFDLSKVQEKSDGSGGTYQFNVKSSNSYSAASNYKNADADMILSVDGKNCYVYYSYLAGTSRSGSAIYMSVELEVENKYYTVKNATSGVVLKRFDYSNGVGAEFTETAVKRGNSLQFAVEATPDSPLYGKKLAVFSQAQGGDKVAVSEYTYNGTVYYSISSINAPTSITVAEGHECIFSEWAPQEGNTSKHERHCTVTGCTASESGYCSDCYGAEYHFDSDTMQKDCTLCGRQYSWQIDASASVHVSASEAECDAPGNIEFWICGHCDKYFTDANCQHEVTPAQVYINPLVHNYVNNSCSECGYRIASARFEESLEDLFDTDGYLYVIIGVGSDGKLYAMGEATSDGRRYGVEIPDAQIDANGVVTLNSDQAEFMNFECYFENGASVSTTYTYIVDGTYMTARNGKIYTFPKDRIDDKSNPRPFDFRQAEYGDESGLGYLYADFYEPDKGHKHTFEYINFNPETHFFEACDTKENSVYIYRQICEHEDIHLSHTYPVAPTCTEQGYGGDYWFCSKCKTYFTDRSCTEELAIPEYENIDEYFLLPALEHSFSSNGVCENCGMKRNVYTPVTSLQQFDKLSENAYYIIVFKDGGKTYAAYIPNLNIMRKMITADSDGDGLIDLLETDVNTNGIPDMIEEYINIQWGGADENEDGTTTADEYKEAIGSLDDDEDVDAEDYMAFFSWHIQYALEEKFWEEHGINHSNVVEVTVAADGSITVIDEGAMEFKMIPSGIWGGQPDFDGDDPEYTITDSERLRAFYIPNYWVANDGRMGEYGANEHFMTQYRSFGDFFAPGITDNKNWKISFNSDGTVLLVSTWTTFDNTAALQLVKYTDGDGNECITMVGCYGERWQYSDLLSNCTVISGAYLYASEPAYDETSHTCNYGAWYEIDGRMHRRDCDCGEFETAPHIFGEWGEYAGFEGITRHCTADGCDAYETKQEEPPHVCEFGDWMPDPNDGMKHVRKCECGESESGDHAFGDFVKKNDEYHTHSCPTCGASEDFEHSFYDWIAKDDNDHVHECMECDYESVLPHSYVREVTKEPTEREVGEATYTCSLCSHSYTEELPRRIAQITADVVGTVLNVPTDSNAYIPEGTVFDVVEQPVEDVPEQVLGEIAVTAKGAVKPLGMYDLSLLLDGARIQPNGTVEITLPAPDLAAEYDSIIVVYIAPDGSYEECKTIVNDDGTITFETDHFSSYAIIGIDEADHGEKDHSRCQANGWKRFWNAIANFFRMIFGLPKKCVCGEIYVK